MVVKIGISHLTPSAVVFLQNIIPCNLFNKKMVQHDVENFKVQPSQNSDRG